MSPIAPIVPPAHETPLPGKIAIGPGDAEDYRALSRHHYRDRRPATFCRILAARFLQPGRPPRVVGVAVLSWPVPMLAPRNRHFAVPPGYGVRLRFANAGVRTISRVIVHPQFRALGLATRLVRALIAACPTRYVESSAAMGRYASFFRAAGMRAIADDASYFVIDRADAPSLTSFAANRRSRRRGEPRTQ